MWRSIENKKFRKWNCQIIKIIREIKKRIRKLKWAWSWIKFYLTIIRLSKGLIIIKNERIGLIVIKVNNKVF